MCVCVLSLHIHACIRLCVCVCLSVNRLVCAVIQNSCLSQSHMFSITMTNQLTSHFRAHIHTHALTLSLRHINTPQMQGAAHMRADRAAWWEMDNTQAQKHGPVCIPIGGTVCSLWWVTRLADILHLSIPTQQPIYWNCAVTLLIKQTFSVWDVRCYSVMGSVVQGEAVLVWVCGYVWCVSHVDFKGMWPHSSKE